MFILREREREYVKEAHHCQHRAQHRAQHQGSIEQTSEIRIWAAIKSGALNRLSHSSNPKFTFKLILTEGHLYFSRGILKHLNLLLYFSEIKQLEVNGCCKLEGESQLNMRVFEII